MKIRLISCFFILFFFVFSYAQKGIVKGYVKDDNGQILPGASVIYRSDITIGSITDENGFYQLNLPIGKCKLTCRYTGMITDTLEPGINQSYI